MTLAELRAAFKTAGATNAINLDGGVSTQFYAPGGKSHYTGRNLRGFIGIWLREEDATPEERFITLDELRKMGYAGIRI